MSNALVNAALELLPDSISSGSISPCEIVLPLREALEAVDVLENKEKLILGWEGWIKTKDGRVGHGGASQGTISFENLSVHEAAEVCRSTMLEDAAAWKKENEGTTDELYFCITVRV